MLRNLFLELLLLLFLAGMSLGVFEYRDEVIELLFELGGPRRSRSLGNLFPRRGDRLAILSEAAAAFACAPGSG